MPDAYLNGSSHTFSMHRIDAPLWEILQPKSEYRSLPIELHNDAHSKVLSFSLCMPASPTIHNSRSDSGISFSCGWCPWPCNYPWTNLGFFASSFLVAKGLAGPGALGRWLCSSPIARSDHSHLTETDDKCANDSAWHEQRIGACVDVCKEKKAVLVCAL